MNTKPYYDKILRVTKAFYNPSYDGRRKYGEESVRVIEAGTPIFVLERKHDDIFTNDSLSLYRGGPRTSESFYRNSSLGKATLENSVIDSPQNWREAVILWTGHINSSNILDQLVEIGLVTVENIKQASIRDIEEDNIVV